MSCLGKVIGGIAGSFITGGNPLGVITGIFIGHLLIDSQDKNNENPNYRHQDVNKQGAFYACFFACLAKMAKVDGRISVDEIEAVNRIMQEMRLPQNKKILAQEAFRRAKDDNHSIDRYLKEFADIVQYDSSIAEILIFSLIKVAIADNNINEKELEILYKAERFLHIPRGYVDAVIAQFGYRAHNRQHSNYNRSYDQNNYKNELENAYKVIGCSSSDSDSEIKKKYRKKCMEHHPDKLQSQGLPKDFIEASKEQMVLINQAYSTICKARNMK